MSCHSWPFAGSCLMNDRQADLEICFTLVFLIACIKKTVGLPLIKLSNEVTKSPVYPNRTICSSKVSCIETFKLPDTTEYRLLSTEPYAVRYPFLSTTMVFSHRLRSSSRLYS